MLTNLINVTGDLFALSLLIGVIFAFVDHFCREKGQLIARCGLALGFVIAAIRAYITNNSRLVGGWRVGAYGYAVSLAIFVFLLVAFVVLFRKLADRPPDAAKASKAEIVISSGIALLTASYLYCALPNVYVYPFKFDVGGNGLLSTDFLFRLGGYLLGILVCLVSAFVAYKNARLSAKKGYAKLLVISFALLNIMYAIYNFARLMLVLTPRKIVDSAALFNFAAASNNNSVWYTYASFFILIILSVILWIRSYTAKEPYSTKAERRKQLAVWRSAKRYSVVLLICFVCSILCATLFVQLNTVVIKEAPVEEPLIVKDGAGADSELRVPLDMVVDGHLHRFGYTTPNGNLVRFIVVLKQENTNNYGVGLDACEICGEAGYYENNDGQIVCKKCSVVMNKTTIGMKGGCNPIIIDYDINENYIVVPVTEMVNNESHFKK
ncbi:MAG: DUF2318 domain-containing protein [Clostridia bacterium]|nr:DUF2318 domain-containing protein [Clostridia bacterium]